ncbi:hypothetical protein CHU98_g6386 [Xylaria longipes]|nr:hypothetical protein CHU98_g6386 [Xylaria longipes]
MQHDLAAQSANRLRIVQLAIVRHPVPTETNTDERRLSQEAFLEYDIRFRTWAGLNTTKPATSPEHEQALSQHYECPLNREYYSRRWPSAAAARILPRLGRNTKQQLNMSCRINPCPSREAPTNVREIHPSMLKTSLQPAESKCSPIDASDALGAAVAKS